MITENTIDTSQAILSNQGDMASFSFAEEQIRFRSPKILERYIDIKEWGQGLSGSNSTIQRYRKSRRIH